MTSEVKKDLDSAQRPRFAPGTDFVGCSNML